MNGDPSLAAGVAALILLLFLFLVQWRFRARIRHDMAGLRLGIELQAAAFEEKHGCLKTALAALEEFVRDVPEPPRPGALNQSARAEALRLLRSGVSADTAASSLGLCKREMRLLERVAHTLYAR
jgi:hypothetical protein